MIRIRHIFLAVIFLSLTACAFHPRSAADIPLPLRHIYLDTKNPYSAFTTELKAMLTALPITLVKTRFNTPYTIRISNYHFLQTNPSITTTSLAVTFTYSITLQISILNQTGKTIYGPKSLGASRTRVQNSSQVYTPGTATLTKQELRQDIISKVYYVLASEDTKRALDNKHHVP